MIILGSLQLGLTKTEKEKPRSTSILCGLNLLPYMTSWRHWAR